jgi:hypothetical protein
MEPIAYQGAGILDLKKVVLIKFLGKPSIIRLDIISSAIMSIYLPMQFDEKQYSFKYMIAAYKLVTAFGWVDAEPSTLKALTSIEFFYQP